MNSYASETIDFFVLVLTSGIIAVAVLAVVSAVVFTLTFGLFRERAAVPVTADDRVTVPRAEPRPAPVVAYAADAPAAVAG
jgi:hypothetical protein